MPTITIRCDDEIKLHEITTYAVLNKLADSVVISRDIDGKKIENAVTVRGENALKDFRGEKTTRELPLVKEKEKAIKKITNNHI